MTQQNIGNNSFTFVINNFQQERKQNFHHDESHVSSKHNLNNPDYSKTYWPQQDNSLNSTWNNSFEGNSQRYKQRKRSNSFGEQKTKPSFENTAVNAKNRKNQKRRKRIRDNTAPKTEFSQFLTGTNSVSSNSYADNHTNRNKGFINVNASNSYNVSYKWKKNRKEFIKWKYTTNKFESNGAKFNNEIQSNGFKSSVNEKEDGDLFYFDISGNKAENESVAPGEDRLNVSKIMQNCNAHLSDKKSNINSSRLNWSNNTNTNEKINIAQSCDNNDSLVDIKSNEIDMLNHTKEETSKKKKKKRKKKNEDEGTLTILDSDCEISSIPSKIELNKSDSDYMETEKNEPLDILSEKGEPRHVEDQTSHKIKKKKRREIRNSTVNILESDCTIIDLVRSSPKKKSKNVIGTISNNTLKKKHTTTIEENYIHKDICISNDANNILNLKTNNNSEEFNKRFEVLEENKLPKVKKKKRKKSIEDLRKKEIDFQYYNDGELKNENCSLSAASGTNTNSVSNNGKLKVKNSNDSNTSECEIIDFVGSNKKKKKRKSPDIECNDNNTHKKKHKIKTSGKDIQENLSEIIDSGIENAFKLPKKGDQDDGTGSPEVSISESQKPVKSKKKKRKIKKEEIIGEDHVQEANAKFNKEREFPDDPSEFFKSLDSKINKMLSGSLGNVNYEIPQNVETKTKRKHKKFKGTDCNFSKDSSDDDCDIVDYVSLKSKKKRRKAKKQEILEIETKDDVLDSSNISLKKARLSSKTALETNDSSCNSDNNSSADRSSGSSEIISFQWKSVKHNPKINENGSNVKGPNSKKSKKKVKDIDTAAIISESECEIIDFVDSNSKKRGKSIAAQSDFYEAPKKKKRKTITNNGYNGSVENELNSPTTLGKNGNENCWPGDNFIDKCDLSKGDREDQENDLSKNKITNNKVTDNDGEIEQKTAPQSFRVSNNIFGKIKCGTARGDIEKLQNKEDGDGKSNSHSRRRMSLFAEYMHSKANVKTEKKPIEPEESADPNDTEEDGEKLRKLTVIFPFSVCPLHSLATTTCKPKQDQLDKIQEMNLPVKSGVFTKEEDEKIMDNWRRLCKEHDLTMNPSVFLKFPPKVKMDTKIDILRYIGRGLDDRLLHRVYARFRHLLQKDRLKTGRFTAEEDEEILEFLANTSSRQPFSVLSKILRRDRHCIERRYNILRSNDKTTTRWTPEMVDGLVRGLLKVTKCEGLEELKDREITAKEWRKTSKKLNVDVNKLKRAWNITIYPRLYCEEDDLKEVKEDIINILCDRKETDWRKVNWKEISSYFKGLTPEKIYMMFKHIVYFQVPVDKRSDLKECLDFLKNQFLKYNDMPATHRLKKYVFKDGHIAYEASQ